MRPMFRFGSQAKKFLPANSVRIFQDAISPTQEASLMHELFPILSRRRYQRAHWDSVIEGYREVERPFWKSPENEATIAKLRGQISDFVSSQAPGAAEPLGYTGEWLPVHVLDLSEEGFITPHVDSVKFSGGLVCGLSLLSSAVMVLSPEDPVLSRSSDAKVEMFLPRRSLYVLSGPARYEFAHSIERNRDNSNASSSHGGSEQTKESEISEFSKRERRVSLILRDAKVEA
mmetsp:Transcript_58680/g.132812  ORF Transcript_58680/g.132812 Transcript_58680/m.132812 type:complete len:231 (+) Transcript_58680:40-732(+)|eukprot:CAMPEP_0172609344 /NCGR_PEP_ID=MMETSP1068-20121228/29352_1 /TAXON_ID=35684 /ORGANISM="Pseudopedinella elastica, Strain CCMP716" /LENGTH=230 /DNA_ID=CAMNT_0013412839 /DNA_START=31 /DNA_END=723 /DNA_ORIENTATION=+